MRPYRIRTRSGLDIELTDPGFLLLDMTEKALTQAVVQLAQALGWTVFRTWLSLHSPSGEPDLRMVHPIKKRVVWAELKTEKGKLTLNQQDAIATLTQAGAEVYVWRPSSWAHIEKVLGRPGR